MNKQKPSIKRVLLTILAILLGLIFAVMLGLTIVVNAMLNKIPREEQVVDTLPPEVIESIVNETDPDLPEEYDSVEPEDITMPTEDAEVLEKENHIFHILLIGQDSEAGIRSRSDSMILCTVNTEEKTLLMTSFLRDLYVDIPDFNGVSYQDNRLNTCYMFGGAEMLNEALRVNFGVEVDHNIAVNFSSFPQIIDILGGVGICLTADEAFIVGDGTKEGFNLLDGDQALRYARIRYLDSDFGRTNRQRTVMVTLLEQLRHASLDQMITLINLVFPLVSTDMTNAEIIGYAVEFFPLLSEIQVSSQYIPADGAYTATYVRGMAVLIPDFEENRRILRETLK